MHWSIAAGTERHVCAWQAPLIQTDTTKKHPDTDSHSAIMHLLYTSSSLLYLFKIVLHPLHSAHVAAFHACKTHCRACK